MDQDYGLWPLVIINSALLIVLGRVGGAFIAFLLPFLDLGITQSPMLHSEPTTLSELLPGYGGSRVLLDGALTSTFDQAQPLSIGVAWLVALGVAVAWLHRLGAPPTLPAHPALVRI